MDKMFKLRPEKEPESVEEMRRLIEKHRLYSPLVNRVYDISGANELSEIDTMTLMSYVAICAYEDALEKLNKANNLIGAALAMAIDRSSVTKQ